MKTGQTHLGTGERLVLVFLFACIAVAGIALAFGVLGLVALFGESQPQGFLGLFGERAPQAAATLTVILGALAAMALLALCLTLFKQLSVLRRIQEQGAGSSRAETDVVEEDDKEPEDGYPWVDRAGPQENQTDEALAHRQSAAAPARGSGLLGRLDRIAELLVGIEAVAKTNEENRQIEEVDRYLEGRLDAPEPVDYGGLAERLDRIAELLESLHAKAVFHGDKPQGEQLDRIAQLLEQSIEAPRSPENNGLAKRLDRIAELLKESQVHGKEHSLAPGDAIVACPSCGQHLRVPKGFEGKAGSCIKCKAVVPLR